MRQPFPPFSLLEALNCSLSPSSLLPLSEPAFLDTKIVVSLTREMESENVSSCAPAPQPAAGVLREEPKSPPKTPDRARYQKNVCFGCNREGHWLRDCPSRAKSSPRSPDPAAAGVGPAGGRRYPERQCPCGRGPCIVLTSRTELNPNRDFYRCPVKSADERCKFFLWCDAASPPSQHGNSPAKPNKNHGADESSYPICSCGAGRCRVLTMQDGEDAGRKYFACRVKKGQGACNHFQWIDGPAKPSETKEYLLGENGHPNFILVSEPKEPRIDGAASEVMKKDSPDEMLPEASIFPEPPPTSPKKRNEPYIMAEHSPMKRLSIHGNSPGASRPGNCFRCGKEGHWLSECVESPNSPCFKCGRFGHWKKDCTE